VAIVEDDDSLARSLARLVRAAGLEPAIYGSAESFLDAGRPGGFDCLILDIQLGGMSGVELAERLRADGTGVPVIFLTALHDPALRVRAAQAGCVAYLRKTESGETLLAAVRRATGGAAGTGPAATSLDVPPFDQRTPT